MAISLVTTPSLQGTVDFLKRFLQRLCKEHALPALRITSLTLARAAPETHAAAELFGVVAETWCQVGESVADREMYDLLLCALRLVGVASYIK